MGAELQAESYSTPKVLPYVHSHIPSCIHNYLLTRIIITCRSQPCFGNFMAAGRDVSPNAQHPSLLKPSAVVIAAAEKLVLHHWSTPVAASRPLAAKAIWHRVLHTHFIKEMQKRKKEYGSSMKWRDFVTVTLRAAIKLGFFGA